MSTKYFVFQCKECGMWSVRSYRHTGRPNRGLVHRCKYCNRSHKVFSKGWSIKSAGPFEEPSIATKVCQNFNEKRFLQND